MVGGPGFETGASRSRTLRESRPHITKTIVPFGFVTKPAIRRYLAAGLLHELVHPEEGKCSINRFCLSR
jgi:hypothetical protein